MKRSFISLFILLLAFRAQGQKNVRSFPFVTAAGTDTVPCLDGGDRRVSVADIMKLQYWKQQGSQLVPSSRYGQLKLNADSVYVNDSTLWSGFVPAGVDSVRVTDTFPNDQLYGFHYSDSILNVRYQDGKSFHYNYATDTINADSSGWQILYSTTAVNPPLCDGDTSIIGNLYFHIKGSGNCAILQATTDTVKFFFISNVAGLIPINKITLSDPQGTVNAGTWDATITVPFSQFMQVHDLEIDTIGVAWNDARHAQFTIDQIRIWYDFVCAKDTSFLYLDANGHLQSTTISTGAGGNGNVIQQGEIDEPSSIGRIDGDLYMKTTSGGSGGDILQFSIFHTGDGWKHFNIPQSIVPAPHAGQEGWFLSTDGTFANWSELPITSDAPNDGGEYVRKNLAWSALTIPDFALKTYVDSSVFPLASQQALDDTATAIRNDFPVPGVSQSALNDTAADIRNDFPAAGVSQLALNDTASAIRSAIPAPGISAITYSQTWAQVVSLASHDSLVPGAQYKIYNRPSKYVNDTLLIVAQASNKLMQYGQRIQYCPAVYHTTTDGSGNVWKGVWQSGKTVTTNSYVIYGGRVWKSLTGSIGSTVSTSYGDSLDATNWVLISPFTFSNNEYTVLNFKIAYDLTTDNVIAQEDNKRNRVGYIGGTFTAAGAYSIACDRTDWNFSAGRESSMFFSDNIVPFGITDNDYATSGTNYLSNNTTATIWNNVIVSAGTGIRGNTSSTLYLSTNGIQKNKITSGVIAYNNAEAIISDTMGPIIYNKLNTGSISNNKISSGIGGVIILGSGSITNLTTVTSVNSCILNQISGNTSPFSTMTGAVTGLYSMNDRNYINDGAGGSNTETNNALSKTVTASLNFTNTCNRIMTLTSKDTARGNNRNVSIVLNGQTDTRTDISTNYTHTNASSGALFIMDSTAVGNYYSDTTDHTDTAKYINQVSTVNKITQTGVYYHTTPSGFDYFSALQSKKDTNRIHSGNATYSTEIEQTPSYIKLRGIADGTPTKLYGVNDSGRMVTTDASSVGKWIKVGTVTYTDVNSGLGPIQLLDAALPANYYVAGLAINITTRFIDNDSNTIGYSNLISADDNGNTLNYGTGGLGPTGGLAFKMDAVKKQFINPSPYIDFSSSQPTLWNASSFDQNVSIYFVSLDSTGTPISPSSAYTMGSEDIWLLVKQFPF